MKKCFSVLLVLLMLFSTAVTVSATELIDLYIQMTVVEDEDGNVVASLVDDRGCTVSNWPVSLEIDGVEVDTKNTDASGDAVFSYDIPADAQQVGCTAINGEYGGYRFIGCSAYLDDRDAVQTDATTAADSEQTTTSAEGEAEGTQSDNTTVPSDSTTPEVSADLATAPITTAVNGNLVAVGIDIDRDLARACGMDAAQMVSQSRMWVDSAFYSSLVSTSNASLHLQLTLNEQAGAQSALLAAKNADPAYASFADSEVLGFAMDMSVAYVDENNRVPIEVSDGMYTLELPVPTTMASCETIAVAVCTQNGLASLTKLYPANGMITFTVQRFQTLAVVGFGEQGAINSLAQTPWMLVAAIIVGVLLIAGGICLLIFVGFRRKGDDSELDDDMDDEAGDETRKAMLAPTAEETLDDSVEELDPGEEARVVLVECDERSELTPEEMETFQTRSTIDQATFDRISKTSVSPARQIGRQQLKTIVEESAGNDPSKNDGLTVDDVLDELLQDLEDLNG